MALLTKRYQSSLTPLIPRVFSQIEAFEESFSNNTQGEVGPVQVFDLTDEGAPGYYIIKKSIVTSTGYNQVKNILVKDGVIT
ncbi:MAG: hypothetical protein COA93_10015 [Alphaproteobacteria bacterium]|nr:MAG: hypothetical protein COA93_10015 [Alphaproteobacteria bacterium]